MSPNGMPAASAIPGSPTNERKRLDTAKQLLSVAIDQAATPAERQLAYRRVREELDGLISLSDEAIVVLEKQVSLELTTGPTAQTAPAAAPGTPAAAPQAAPRDRSEAVDSERRPLAGAGAHHRDGARARRAPQAATLTRAVSPRSAPRSR